MNEGDAGAVAALSAQLGYPAPVATIAARIRVAQGAADGALLVAEGGRGAVAGWIQIATRRTIESEAHAEIVGLVVEREHRRRGAGRALVEAAEAWARGRGFATLRVRSNVTREEAHPFYARLGFRLLKTQHVYERPVTRAREDRP